MMGGEFDIGDSFLWDESREKGSHTSPQLVFVLFYIIVSIAISNLLIGLTVSKTEELYKTARENRIEQTEKQVMETEIIFNQMVSKCCQISFLKKWLLGKSLLFQQLEILERGRGMNIYTRFKAKILKNCPF